MAVARDRCTLPINPRHSCRSYDFVTLSASSSHMPHALTLPVSAWPRSLFPHSFATIAPQVPTQPTRRMPGASMSHFPRTQHTPHCQSSQCLHEGPTEERSKAHGVRQDVRRTCEGHNACSNHSHIAVQLCFRRPYALGARGARGSYGPGSWRVQQGELASISLGTDRTMH